MRSQWAAFRSSAAALLLLLLTTTGGTTTHADGTTPTLASALSSIHPHLVLHLAESASFAADDVASSSAFNSSQSVRLLMTHAADAPLVDVDEITMALPMDVCATRRHCAGCLASSADQRRLLPNRTLDDLMTTNGDAPAAATEEAWNVADIFRCVAIWGQQSCQIWSSTVGLLFDSLVPPSGVVSRNSSLLHVVFPRWCTCGGGDCPDFPQPPTDGLRIESAVYNVTTRTLSVRASSPLSLPSLTPDLASLFDSATLASFGSAPTPAVWIAEQELRIDLNASTDSTLVEAGRTMSATNNKMRRVATSSSSSSTPFGVLPSGWRARGYPSVWAVLSPEIATGGITIVYPPPSITPSSTGVASSSTGQPVAPEEAVSEGSSSFLSSTQNQVGLGVGLGVGVLLIGTLVACVWWGRHSSASTRRKFTASSRNLALHGVGGAGSQAAPSHIELTPDSFSLSGSPASYQSASGLGGSSPKLDPMSAAFEHFPSPSSPRMSPRFGGGGGAARRNKSPNGSAAFGFGGDDEETKDGSGEVVLHMIPEAEDEHSRSTRPASRLNAAQPHMLRAGRSSAAAEPRLMDDVLDLGEVVLSRLSDSENEAADDDGRDAEADADEDEGEPGRAGRAEFPSPLQLGARAASLDELEPLASSESTGAGDSEDIDELRRQMAILQAEIAQRRAKEKKLTTDGPALLKKDLTVALGDVEAAAATTAGGLTSKHPSHQQQERRGQRFEENISIELQPMAAAATTTATNHTTPAAAASAALEESDSPSDQSGSVTRTSSVEAGSLSVVGLRPPSSSTSEWSSCPASLAGPLSTGDDTPAPSRPSSLQSHPVSLVANTLPDDSDSIGGGGPAPASRFTSGESFVIDDSRRDPIIATAMISVKGLPRGGGDGGGGMGVTMSTEGSPVSSSMVLAPPSPSITSVRDAASSAWELTETPLASPSANVRFLTPEEALSHFASSPLASPLRGLGATGGLVQFDDEAAHLFDSDEVASSDSPVDLSRATSLHAPTTRPPLVHSASTPLVGASPITASASASASSKRRPVAVRIHSRFSPVGGAIGAASSSPSASSGSGGAASTRSSPSTTPLSSPKIAEPKGTRAAAAAAVAMATGSDGVPRAAPAPLSPLAAGSGGLSGASKKATLASAISPPPPSSSTEAAGAIGKKEPLQVPPTLLRKKTIGIATGGAPTSPSLVGNNASRKPLGTAAPSAGGKMATMLSLWLALACCLVVLLPSVSTSMVVEAKRTIRISFRDLYDAPANSTAPLQSFPLRSINGSASGLDADVEVVVDYTHVLRGLDPTSNARYGVFCDATPPACADIVVGATPPSYAASLASSFTPYTTLSGACRTSSAYAGTQGLQCARPGGLLEVRWLLLNTGALAWKADDVAMVSVAPAPGWPTSRLTLESPTPPGQVGSFVGLVRGPIQVGVWNHTWAVASTCLGTFGAYQASLEYTCSNGVFCDGMERLVNGTCVSAVRSACDDSQRCTLDTCDEANALCTYALASTDSACTFTPACATVSTTSTCVPQCGTSRACGDDSCAGSCGGCPTQFSCSPVGQCKSISSTAGTCYSDVNTGSRAIPLVKSTESLLGNHSVTVDLSKGLAQARLSCASDANGPQLVYTFTLPSDTGVAQYGADLRFSNGLGTAGATMDTLLELRKGYCFDSTTLVPVTVVTSGPGQNTWCNDNASPPGGKGAGLILTLTPGTYYLYASGYNSQQNGFGTLSATFTSGYTPDCAGRMCGPDGGGGSCGACPYGTVCDDYLQCTAPDSLQCTTQRCQNGTAMCGSDNCGGSGTCGPLNGLCPSGQLCIAATGQCATFPTCDHFAPTCTAGCNATEYCGTDCQCHSLALALPDLALSAAVLRSSVTFANRSFDAYSCALSEQCIGGLGQRSLLRFDAQILNQGRAKLTLPNPKLRPDEFQYAPCHNHYHYIGFADYQLLLPGTLTVVARTQRSSSCMVSESRGVSSIGPDIPCRGTMTTCDAPGLDRGWLQTMVGTADCQWIDITGVPSGNYTLRVEINAQRRVLEETYDNNVQTIAVTLP